MRRLKKNYQFSRLKFLMCAFVSLGVAFGISQAEAQQRVVPGSKDDVLLSFAPVVKTAVPAVVNVYGARVQPRDQRSMMMDDFFRDFFRGPGSFVPRERIQRSLGSGVVVDKNLVVTNNHVVEGMTEVRIAFADKREFDAEIVLKDARSDLAVLRVKDLPEVQPIVFGDSEHLEVGDIVLAIGNPFGVGQTVTQGIISAVARTQVGISDYRFFIQTDAAINPGNSGGALIDMKGQLVGINTAIYSRSGGNIGLGFAIPSSMVKMVVDSARSGGTFVKRPWLGARLQAVTQEMADALGLEQPTGVMVTSVFPKSPAEDAGLKRGDMIMVVDGHPIDDPDAFGYRFALQGIGGLSKMTILREGKELLLDIKLISPSETRPRDAFLVETRSPLMGVTVINLSPAVAEELQMDVNEAQDSVIIYDIQDRSPAQRFGFQKGDILLAINREKIEKTQDIRKALEQPVKFWEFTINRGGRVITSVLR